jgi:hypothetical protein
MAAFAATLSLIAMGSPAYAGGAFTYNFDDLSSPLNNGIIQNGYGGLNWSNFGWVNRAYVTANYGPSGYANGTVSGPNVAYNESGDPASITSPSSSFGLVSGYFTGAWNNGLSVTVTGKKGGSIVDTKTFLVNTTGPTLETFDWSGLDEIDFASSGGTPDAGVDGRGTHFAMDNLTLTPVPEAGTVILFGVLAVGSVLILRKKSSTSS